MDKLVLHLVSFNCRGWNNGRHYLTDFSDSFDICLVQEHWLFNAQLPCPNFNNHILSCGVSGMEDGSLLLGWPYGGCGIIFKKSLLERIKVPFKCFCAISLNLSSRSIIIISAYLPTDYRNLNSDDDFLHSLGELGGFINSQSFDDIIIGGDFNTDFNNPSFRTFLLNNFMEEYDLVAIDTAFSPLLVTLMNVIMDTPHPGLTTF